MGFVLPRRRKMKDYSKAFEEAFEPIENKDLGITKATKFWFGVCVVSFVIISLSYTLHI